MIVLYTVDQVTLRATGTTEIEVDIEDPRLVSAQELWRLAGKRGKVLGSVWPSPQDDFIFDGNGWRLPPDASELATLLVNGTHFDLDYVRANQMAEDVLIHVLKEIPEPQLKSIYSTSEVLLFDAQVVEAQGFIGGTISEPPLLTAVAESQGQSVGEVAQSVLDKSNARRAEEAAYLANVNRHRRTLKEIRELGSVEEALERAIDYAKTF